MANNNNNKTKVLFVAEKPSIAKTLAEVFSQGRLTRRNGVSPYNHNFEFDLDLQVSPDPSVGRFLSVICTSVSGHLTEQEFSGAYSSWDRSNMKDLFGIAPVETFVKKEESSEQIGRNLINEAKKCKLLVIWTDCDREGEYIGYEVQEQCKKGNPRILTKRAQFSAANPADLLRAVNSLRNLDMRMVDAVAARTELDLRLGAAFTRWQTLTIRKDNPTQRETVSFGPCQFPTLGFVVARYEAILAFVEEKFWSLKMTLNSTSSSTTAEESNNNSPQQSFAFNWARYRLFDENCAFIIFQLCNTALLHRSGVLVTSISRKPTTKYKPIPLSTIELQVRASRMLHLSSEVVMQTAEKLYNAGLISYPRTETEVFNESFDLRALIDLHKNSQTVGQYATHLLTDANAFSPPRAGKKNDEAHPPIHPVKCVAFDSFPNNSPEGKIYEFIVRHFLACCSQDAKGAESVIHSRLASESFSVKGLVVQEKNYLNVYPYEKWGDKSLPNLKEGDTFYPSTFDLVEGKTTPPMLLSESDLIRLMEKNGIGTDATTDQHIKTIQTRKYVRKVQNDKFEPTPLGLELLRAYAEMGHEDAFGKPIVRASMELDFVKICRGERNKTDVVRDISNKYLQIFNDVLRKEGVFLRHVGSIGMENMNEEEEYNEMVVANISTCGSCHSTIDLRRSSTNANRVGMFCTGGEICEAKRKRFLRLPFGDVFARHPDNFTCPICNYGVVGVVKDGKVTHYFCPDCFCDPPFNRAGGGEEEEVVVIVDLEENVGPNRNNNNNNNTGTGGVEERQYVSTMSCFDCLKRDCPLSGAEGKLSITPCVVCKKTSLCLRKSAQGVKYLSCKNYPTCLGRLEIPKIAKQVIATEQKCTVCLQQRQVTSILLEFHFLSKDVPPGTNTLMKECPIPSCESHSSDYCTIMEMCQMNFSSNNNNNNNKVNSNGSNNNNHNFQGSFQSNNNKGFFLSNAVPVSSSFSPPNNTGVGQSPVGFDLNNPFCFRCKSYGHLAGQCGNVNVNNVGVGAFPTTYGGSNNYYDSNNNNNRNKSYGHPAPPPPPSSFSGPKAGNCYKCGQPGHFSNACTMTTATSGGGGGGGMASRNMKATTTTAAPMATTNVTCYKCKQVGHFANKCPNGNMIHVTTQPPPFNNNINNNNNNNKASSSSKYHSNNNSKPPRVCQNCGVECQPKIRRCKQCGKNINGEGNNNNN